MNIVLLSGGSGKRLWPLSSGIRSKQFLKVLRAPDNTHESMVQRIYRQMHEAGIDAPVVISTTDAQQHTIRAQLGNEVGIALEPERRDTFPAIALASVYLADKVHCGMDETVLVMPVDPYTEAGYFKTLLEMDKAVQSGVADMVLMGVRPTHPSRKYGYIVPKAKQISDVMSVSHFEEKPSTERAQELLEQGAFWNGGVFAFKLRYILDVVSRYIEPKSYEYLRENYGKLRKNSFDYEVVESCKSIAMIPYYGVWKDLGTWNTLSEVMKEPYSGNVICGEGMENTHIINELDIPIIALGVKNAVIAAGPDGILVTDKAASTQLKPYADQIDQRPMYEERQWGSYKVLNYMAHGDGNRSLTKHIVITTGKRLSYQRHSNRDEIWTVLDGTGDLLIDGHVRNVRRGDVVYILKGQLHSIRATTELHLIEVQIGPELTEEDVERFEWDW